MWEIIKSDLETEPLQVFSVWTGLIYILTRRFSFSHSSPAQDCGQPEQLGHGADRGQQRDPGVPGLRLPRARGGLEEGGRQGDHRGQEQHR